MPTFLPLAITTAMGLINSYQQNQRAQDIADQQRKIEKAKAKWYGWTKEAPKAVADTNLLGDLIQGGVGGFLGGTDILKAMNEAKNTDSIDQLMNRYKADAASQQGMGFSPQASQWQQLMYPQQRSYGLGTNIDFSR